MLNSLLRVSRESGTRVREKIIAIYVALVLFNVGAWALLVLAATTLHNPALFGSGLLAYGFGLRHAVDADHIAAIDNVTRKLMQQGKRPVAVGTFFSLGHSTVVIFLSILLGAAAVYVQQNLSAWQNIGGIVGTLVSATFLYLIALLNLVVLVDIFKAFRKVTHGGEYDANAVEEFLNQRGFLQRFFRPFFNLINDSWMMYPLGLLFGLGFDTATEVGVLTLSVISAQSGVPFIYVLALPLLFTAGMSLADTTDGVLMLGAYGWAFVKPVRKLYYNLNITLISVLVAFVVGTIELVQILSSQLNLQGPVWDFINNTLDLGNLGFFIVGILIAGWLVSMLVYRIKRYEELDAPTPTETPSAA